VFVAGAAKTPRKAAPVLKGIAAAACRRLGGVGDQILAGVALVLGLSDGGFVEVVLFGRGRCLLRVLAYGLSNVFIHHFRGALL
jgi:hypothetical protein